MVVNVLWRSKLIYLARVHVLTAWVLSRVNLLKWPFIWTSFMETVSRLNTCFMKTQSGGPCLDNIDLRYKSLRLVVMTVPFYYVNILSGAGCLALDPNEP